MFSSFLTDALCYVKFLLDDTWSGLLLWIQHSFNTSAWMWIKKNTMLDMFYWQYCLCLGDNASLFIQVRSNIVLANHLIKEIYRFKLSWFIDHDINCKMKPSFVIYLSLLWSEIQFTYDWPIDYLCIVPLSAHLHISWLQVFIGVGSWTEPCQRISRKLAILSN